MDFSEPREKILTFKLKIPTPTKRSLVDPCLNQLVMEHRSHLQATQEGNQLWSLNSLEHRHKNYSKLEWSLVYVEEDGVLLLIFATIEGKGKLQLGKSFNYGKVRNIEYEDSDSPISSLTLRTQWVHIVHSSLGFLLGVNYHFFYDWKVIVVQFVSMGTTSCVTGYKVVHNFLKHSSFLKLRWFALLFKFLLSKYQ